MRDVRELPNYRDALMAAVLDLAAGHQEVVFLDADVSSCIGSTAFSKAYPDRAFNIGIAEANMAGVAAGMASVGLRPFIHTFGCFVTRRAYDQLFISVGYTRQCVHVIGSDPGIVAQYNGGTHMPFEDIALMRQIPGFAIVEPSDAQSLYDLTIQLYQNGTSSYMRVPRKGTSVRYAPGEVVLGKGVELADGKDVALIATGAVMVDAALGARDILKAKGIDATVIDLHTIRPLDTDIIDKAASRCGHVLVMENGRYAGGIGEMIAAYLARTNPVRMDFLSVGERFGEVGNLRYLASAFGFTAENAAAKAEGLIR